MGIAYAAGAIFVHSVVPPPQSLPSLARDAGQILSIACLGYALLAGGTVWLVRRWRCVGLPPPDRCYQCGYMLRGLPEPRCPECGEPFDPARFKPETADDADVPEA